MRRRTPLQRAKAHAAKGRNTVMFPHNARKSADDWMTGYEVGRQDAREKERRLRAAMMALCQEVFLFNCPEELQEWQAKATKFLMKPSKCDPVAVDSSPAALQSDHGNQTIRSDPGTEPISRISIDGRVVTR